MGEYLEQLFSLRGRVAIVTNASTELGIAIVRGMAQSGAMVCGADDRFSFEGREAVRASKPFSFDRHFEFQLLCDCLYEKYSKFNLLINVEEIDIPSAVLEPTDLATAKANNFRQAIEMQLERANQASRLAAKKIKQSGGGSIVNIISIKNAIGFPDGFSYIATKNALLMITKKLTTDLIKDNIRVNNIVIGYAENTLAKGKQTVYPSDRSYRDLIEATVYLASDNSGSITGQDIFIVGNRKITSLV